MALCREPRFIGDGVSSSWEGSDFPPTGSVKVDWTLPQRACDHPAATQALSRDKRNLLNGLIQSSQQRHLAVE
jgi:hypothetical protein